MLQLNRVSMYNFLQPKKKDKFLHTNIIQKIESLRQEGFVLSQGDMLEWKSS